MEFEWNLNRAEVRIVKEAGTDIGLGYGIGDTLTRGEEKLIEN